MPAERDICSDKMGAGGRKCPGALSPGRIDRTDEVDDKRPQKTTKDQKRRFNKMSRRMSPWIKDHFVTFAI